MLPAIPATNRLSDSSDSNADDPHGRFNNEPFVNIAECTSLHEGRQQISTILPVNIDTLFHTLYARSKFLEDFHASRKIFDIEHTDWRLDEETNKRRRTFKCKMPIKASFGPKFSCVSAVGCCIGLGGIGFDLQMCVASQTDHRNPDTTRMQYTGQPLFD